ncbi:MAG: hypothetical protein NTW74_19445 [Acidobacteria bacterium]|nr:hypothetical protein [Acidobacteriota bacterium]
MLWLLLVPGIIATAGLFAAILAYGEIKDELAAQGVWDPLVEEYRPFRVPQWRIAEEYKKFNSDHRLLRQHFLGSLFAVSGFALLWLAIPIMNWLC